MIVVHGLTRNSRDFDVFAERMSSVSTLAVSSCLACVMTSVANSLVLSQEYRVICIDVAGRGRSDWLVNKNNYVYAQYMADINAVLARVRTKNQVDFSLVVASCLLSCLSQ